MQTTGLSHPSNQACNEGNSSLEESIISFQSEIPLALKNAMSQFIQRYPNWDQYRLTQAALAGFLVQNGIESRQITRLYIENMFSTKSSSPE